MPNDLLGAAEVAEYLGWTSQKVTSYLAHSKAGIPEPIQRLRSGPVWRREDIVRWARERGYVREEG